MAGYMDRALKAKDQRFARILSKLGHERRDMVAADQVEDPAPDDLSDLRAEYQDAVGKKPFHGWDADTLRDKINESKE